MRISDWSSDVCSSDLRARCRPIRSQETSCCPDCRLPSYESPPCRGALESRRRPYRGLTSWSRAARRSGTGNQDAVEAALRDRKSVVKGKRVAVRVGYGGRGSITKKQRHREE